LDICRDLRPPFRTKGRGADRYPGLFHPVVPMNLAAINGQDLDLDLITAQSVLMLPETI